MARAPDEKITQAHELYKQGMKLVDIADKLNVPAGTVRRWKCTKDWDNEKKTGERSVNKSERSHKASEQNKKEKKVLAREVESVMSNSDLNDKQRLFCLYYSKSFNATQSYKKAYEVDYQSAMVLGCNLLRNINIREEIAKLKEQRYSRALLKPEDIFQKYLEIAYSDITAFTTFGKKKVIKLDEDGNANTVEVSCVDINESAEVDGTLISEISQGKEGIKVKLLDKMKALQWLTDHMSMATDEQKARLDNIKAQTSRLQGSEDVAELDRLDEVLDSIKGVV